MGLLRRRLKPLPPTADEAPWALSERMESGQLMLVRRNLALEARAGDPRYGQALLVVVEDDLEDPETLARLSGFEDALFGVLGHREVCWPAAVMTRPWVRSFLLYTSDPEAPSEGLAFIRQEFPQAFEQQVLPDPRWALYARLAS